MSDTVACLQFIDGMLNRLQVMLPNGQAAKAEQLLKEHSQHLSKDTEAVRKSPASRSFCPVCMPRNNSYSSWTWNVVR